MSDAEAGRSRRERIVGTWLHDLLGGWVVFACYAPIVLSLGVFAHARTPATFAFAFVVVGFRMNALFVLVHESWHYNLFRSRRVNEWIGGALGSYPIVAPYFQDRTSHWNHHRYVGTLRDPNSWAWDFPDGDRRVFLRELLRIGSGVAFAERILRLVLRRPAPPPPPDRPPRPVLEGDMAKREIKRLALVHVVILGLFTVTIGWPWYFLLWLLPAVTLYPAVALVRELLEHRRGALIVYETGPLERFLFGCFNFHLHAFHHAHASAPWFVLPELRAIATRKQPGIVFLRSYVVELARYLRGTSTVPHRAPSGAEPMPAGDVPLDARGAVTSTP